MNEQISRVARLPDKTEVYEAIVEYLVSERKRRGLTQTQLADVLERPQSFVSKYENLERRLDIAEFLLVARGIGVNPHEAIESLHLFKNGRWV